MFIILSNFKLRLLPVNPSESAYYSSDYGLYHNHCQAMGTRLDLILHGVERNAGDQAFGMVQRQVSELERTFSRYDENSPISMINRLGSRRSVVIGEDLFTVLSLCKDYHERTGGLFDIGMGKATAQVRNGNRSNQRLIEMLMRSGVKNIILDSRRQAVKFMDEQVEIDLGGFGKGYALDLIKVGLIEFGISDAFISFGDSSVLALGNHPHGPGWKSGISNIYKPGESLFTFDLKNESLSTSGTVPNPRSDMPLHILHPVKGMLEPGFRHISVVSSLAADAEVLSTALMAATDEEKGKTIDRFPGCRTVEVSYDAEGNALVRELTTTDTT